jgi:TPR repeat protein
MYVEGRGVPQDDAEAARWYRKAAEQENEEAQRLLGEMYRDGRGVPKDYVQAYMWFNLAAARRSEPAAQGRDLLEHSMTPAQIAEAQKLAREWKPIKKPPQ